MQNHYDQMERTLQQLSELLNHPDFVQELTFARELIDHAEYGLALSTLVEMMTTYDRRPSRLEHDLIQQAAQARNLPEAGDEKTKSRFDWLAANVTPPS